MWVFILSLEKRFTITLYKLILINQSINYNALIWSIVEYGIPTYSSSPSSFIEKLNGILAWRLRIRILDMSCMSFPVVFWRSWKEVKRVFLEGLLEAYKEHRESTGQLQIIVIRTITTRADSSSLKSNFKPTFARNCNLLRTRFITMITCWAGK